MDRFASMRLPAVKTFDRHSLADTLFVNGSALAFAALMCAVAWALQIGHF